mgnify:CR=1 FL=1
MTEKEIQALLPEVRDGNVLAFSKIWMGLDRLGMKIALDIVKDQEEARDVLANLAVGMLRRMQKPDPIANFVGYYSTSVRNAAVRSTQGSGTKHRREQIPIDEAHEVQDDALAPDEDLVQRELVESCMALLKNRGNCVKIVSLFYLQGLSLEEIAQQLSYASADAAKVTKNRCLKWLREQLGR